MTGSTAYTYAANRLEDHYIQDANGNTTFASVFYYDANGNLTQQYCNDTTSKYYSYDAWNRLTGYTSRDGVSTTYTYNGNNRRTSKTTGTTTTNYYWDRDYVSMETGGASAGTNVITPHGIVARYGVGGFFFLGKDGHGDVRRAYAQGETIEGEYVIANGYTYDAFGNEKSPDSADTNPIRYCGEYYDSESGLIYLRNRYYDPDMGRFLTEDPYWNTDNMIYGDNAEPTPDFAAIMQSNNLYAYCMNNPVNYTDILGTDAIVANQTDNVAGFGHMSAFVQDDAGDWYFFYWGLNSVSLTKVDDPTILKDSSKINEWIKKENLNHGGHDYDLFCYIEGDFSASKEYYEILEDKYNQSISKSDKKNKDYNWWSQNCTQKTMHGLYLGEIGVGENVYSLRQVYTNANKSISVVPNANIYNLRAVFGWGGSHEPI